MARLPRPETALTILRLVPAYLAAGVLKRVVPISTLARWAWRPPAGRRNPAEERRLVRCVVRLSKLAPFGDANCLQRSLLLYRELSRGGADPRLVIGFRRREGRVDGHAWVEVAGDVVGEPATLRDAGYLECVTFGPLGLPPANAAAVAAPHTPHGGSR
jgi:hypothetical protein